MMVFVVAGMLASSDQVAPQRLLALLVFAPLVEEAVFRAGLQEFLLRRELGGRLANGITAVAFALGHLAVRAQAGALAVVVPALLIGAVYGRRRRLRHCVALHAALNALWLAWALFDPAKPWDF